MFMNKIDFNIDLKLIMTSHYFLKYFYEIIMICIFSNEVTNIVVFWESVKVFKLKTSITTSTSTTTTNNNL